MWPFVLSFCMPWRHLKKERSPIQNKRKRDRQREEGRIARVT